DLADAAALLRELVQWLRAREIEVWLEEKTAALADGALMAGCRRAPGVEVGAASDALVVLGGDGTLLRASRLLKGPTPVLGVNFGALGFLTEITLPELYETLTGLLAGTYRTEDRRLLRAVLRRGADERASAEVLNDVVVTKAALARIIELDVTVDGAFMSSFRADGLIVSSPTGSTAYNLAAGGPIIHPTLGAMVLTPISPHMLTHRPLVIGDHAEVEVRLRRAREGDVHVSFDGQGGVPMLGDDRVIVTRSERILRLVKAPGRDYFEVLRTKLKWGER
ncbi:MAG TPA: NAD(+)/NADH kinase, partial [Vicinamibacteria bacterium]|nr:NAD(+)/NADH kinase [Vicinamibacteria bacterium]